MCVTRWNAAQSGIPAVVTIKLGEESRAGYSEKHPPEGRENYGVDRCCGVRYS